jgi:hypothetical protein
LKARNKFLLDRKEHLETKKDGKKWHIQYKSLKSSKKP